jgi:hypothetical protein
MYYPETHLKIATSSREIRQGYLIAKSGPRESNENQLVELEKLIDPVKRALYDHELGLDELTIGQAIQNESNSWAEILKYGLVCLAVLLLLASDNVVRLYGFMLAPDFKEKVAVEYGEFEREDGMGRVVEVSDHRYYSVYSSSSKTWQFILAHPFFLLQLPTIAALVLIAFKGGKWFNRFVSMRIARARANGEDDTLERRLWVAVALLSVSSLWLVACLFGSNRMVPISQ